MHNMNLKAGTTMKPNQRAFPRTRLGSLGAISIAGLLLAGCASTDPNAAATSGTTASDKTRMTNSGFLSDYARLKPLASSEAMQCWRTADLDLKKYNKVLISRMVVTLKDGQGKGVDPTDLKTLTDYFQASLVKAFAPQMPAVESPAADVLVLRIALTDLVPTSVGKSVTATIVPFGFVADAGAGAATGRPAGATPYLGETGVEMQFLDGGSASVLGECRDTEIGRKYAADLNAGAAGAAETWANGYMGSFDSWTYAKDAFDKWSAITAKVVTQLRATKA